MFWLILVTLVNAAYIAALPSPTIFYVANLLLHLGLGAALAGWLVWKSRRNLRSLPLAAAALLGAYLAVFGATTDHRSANYRKPALILMGNEQQGLPPDMAALCDVNVKISMRGRADSLNLSVATGIMIYAAT